MASFFKPCLGALLSLSMVFQSIPASTLEEGLAPQVPDPISLLDYYPPSNLAKVTDSYNAGFVDRVSGFESRTTNHESRPLVILIQDLHCHPGVQKKISELLDFYAHKGISSNFIAIEGAQGLLDTSLLALFPDAEIRKQVAQEYLEKGELSGVEDYSIRNGKPHVLWGVDDKKTYDLNRKLFQATLQNRSQLASQIKALQTRLKALEPQIYNRSMRSLKDKSQTYEQGKLSLKKYLSHLMEEAESARLKVPAELFQMQGLLKLETRNQKLETLNKQTQQLLIALHPKLSQEETDRLAFYAKAEPTVYYLYLDGLVKKHRMWNSCPETLKNHLKYTHGLENLSLQAFQKAMGSLEYKVLLSKAKSDSQKGLVKSQRDLRLVHDLLEHKLVKDDFKEVLTRRQELLAMLEKLLNTLSEGDKELLERATRDERRTPGALKELLAEAIDFYALALMRDESLVSQTLAKLNTSVPSPSLEGEGQDEGDQELLERVPSHESRAPHENRVAILVTGGFHSSGIAKALKEQGISYLTLSPVVDSYTDADQARYINRLMEDEKPPVLQPQDTLVMLYTFFSGRARAIRRRMDSLLQAKQAGIPISEAKPAVSSDATTADKPKGRWGDTDKNITIPGTEQEARHEGAGLIQVMVAVVIATLLVLAGGALWAAFAGQGVQWAMALPVFFSPTGGGGSGGRRRTELRSLEEWSALVELLKNGSGNLEQLQAAFPWLTPELANDPQTYRYLKAILSSRIAKGDKEFLFDKILSQAVVGDVEDLNLVRNLSIVSGALRVKARLDRPSTISALVPYHVEEELVPALIELNRDGSSLLEKSLFFAGLLKNCFQVRDLGIYLSKSTPSGRPPFPTFWQMRAVFSGGIKESVRSLPEDMRGNVEKLLFQACGSFFDHYSENDYRVPGLLNQLVALASWLDRPDAPDSLIDLKRREVLKQVAPSLELEALLNLLKSRIDRLPASEHQPLLGRAVDYQAWAREILQEGDRSFAWVLLKEPWETWDSDKKFLNFFQHSSRERKARDADTVLGLVNQAAVPEDLGKFFVDYYDMLMEPLASRAGALTNRDLFQRIYETKARRFLAAAQSYRDKEPIEGMYGKDAAMAREINRVESKLGLLACYVRDPSPEFLKDAFDFWRKTSLLEEQELQSLNWLVDHIPDSSESPHERQSLHRYAVDLVERRYQKEKDPVVQFMGQLLSLMKTGGLDDEETRKTVKNFLSFIHLFVHFSRGSQRDTNAPLRRELSRISAGKAGPVLAHDHFARFSDLLFRALPPRHQHRVLMAVRRLADEAAAGEEDKGASSFLKELLEVNREAWTPETLREVAAPIWQGEKDLLALVARMRRLKLPPKSTRLLRSVYLQKWLAENLGGKLSPGALTLLVMDLRDWETEHPGEFLSQEFLDRSLQKARALLTREQAVRDAPTIGGKLHFREDEITEEQAKKIEILLEDYKIFSNFRPIHWYPKYPMVVRGFVYLPVTKDAKTLVELMDRVTDRLGKEGLMPVKKYTPDGQENLVQRNLAFQLTTAGPLRNEMLYIVFTNLLARLYPTPEDFWPAEYPEVFDAVGPLARGGGVLEGQHDSPDRHDDVTLFYHWDQSSETKQKLHDELLPQIEFWQCAELALQAWKKREELKKAGKFPEDYMSSYEFALTEMWESQDPQLELTPERKSIQGFVTHLTSALESAITDPDKRWRLTLDSRPDWPQLRAYLGELNRARDVPLEERRTAEGEPIKLKHWVRLLREAVIEEVRRLQEDYQAEVTALANLNGDGEEKTDDDGPGALPPERRPKDPGQRGETDSIAIAVLIAAALVIFLAVYPLLQGVNWADWWEWVMKALEPDAKTGADTLLSAISDLAAQGQPQGPPVVPPEASVALVGLMPQVLGRQEQVREKFFQRYARVLAGQL